MSDAPTSDAPAPRPSRPDTPSGLPVIEPHPLPDAQPFFDAAAEGRLSLPVCDACSTAIWYPRGFCPTCGSLEVTWVDLPGTGIVYSSSVSRRGQGPYRDVAPYVVAYVELDLPDAPAGDPDAPNPRCMTNVVGCPVEEVVVGLPVTAVFDPTPDGDALVRFRPR